MYRAGRIASKMSHSPAVALLGTPGQNKTAASPSNSSTFATPRTPKTPKTPCSSIQFGRSWSANSQNTRPDLPFPTISFSTAERFGAQQYTHTPKASFKLSFNESAKPSVAGAKDLTSITTLLFPPGPNFEKSSELEEEMQSLKDSSLLNPQESSLQESSLLARSDENDDSLAEEMELSPSIEKTPSEGDLEESPVSLDEETASQSSTSQEEESSLSSSDNSDALSEEEELDYAQQRIEDLIIPEVESQRNGPTLATQILQDQPLPSVDSDFEEEPIPSLFEKLTNRAYSLLTSSEIKGLTQSCHILAVGLLKGFQVLDSDQISTINAEDVQALSREDREKLTPELRKKLTFWQKVGDFIQSLLRAIVNFITSCCNSITQRFSSKQPQKDEQTENPTTESIQPDTV